MLQTFDAVCLAGSLKRAAEHSNLTQSAVSMQIKRLEEVLGQRLLERSNQGLRITPAGEKLRAHTRNLLRLETAAVGDMHETRLAGEIRIGVPTDYAPSLLSVALPYLNANFPGVIVSVECDLSRRLREKIARDQLDLAIITLEPALDEGDILWREALVWAQPARFCGADQPLPIGLLDVDCPLRDMTLSAAKRQQGAFRVAFRSTSLASIQAAVTDGFCASLLPASTLNFEQPAGVRLDGSYGELVIGLLRSDAVRPQIAPLAHFLKSTLSLMAPAERVRVTDLQFAVHRSGERRVILANEAK
ncbi:LysR family transcriptional regulator [Novosphingobium sp.]|uniref:LysR family transcriptional regulator n=1 Tax=Novosphingobium sp. TaxID=1874826 RepID=UPI003B51842C